MKRKSVLAPRNKFVVLAKHCKAGFHGKSEKALRREAKVNLWGYNSKARISGSYPADYGSSPYAPTN